MTLPLIFAAVVEQAAEPDMLTKFGVEWKYVVWQLVSFVIVLFVLYKFGIKPVSATMEERTRKIESGIKYAEEMQIKLIAAQQESTTIVKKSQVEATRIIEDARRTAKDYLDKQTQEASGKANEMLVKAQQAIELEHKKMLADARTEIARLVVLTTERVLAQKLSESDRAAYNAAATNELTEIRN